MRPKPISRPTYRNGIRKNRLNVFALREPQTTGDFLCWTHSVSLRLIEDAVHFGGHATNSPAAVALAAYVAKNL